MDKIIRDFIWEVKDSHSHHLYLKFWMSICKSKNTGGLGIRSMIDVNSLLMTKLVKNLMTTEDKPWAQLIRARYLRGKNMQKANRETTVGSWIWGSIKKCLLIIRDGACYQIGLNSQINLRSMPWIISLKGFKILVMHFLMCTLTL